MFMGYCKICCLEFDSSTLCQPLFINAQENRLSKVGQMFIHCIFPQIKPTNGLFDRLCTECGSKLLEYYKFRLEAIDTNNKFAELFNKGQGVIDEEIIELNEYESEIKIEEPSNVEAIEYLDEDLRLDDTITEFDDRDYSSLIEIEQIKTEGEEYVDELEDHLTENNDSDDKKLYLIGNSSSIDDNELKESIVEPPRRRKKNISNRWCELCNIYLDTVKELARHNKDLHSLCEQCNKTFKGPLQLKLHIQKIHVRKLICRYCGYVVKSSPSMLARHEARHSNHRPFACELCDKRCHDMNDLKIHFRSHTDERPFVCECCGKGFRVQSHMVAHLESHNKEKMFKCEDCEKTFQRSISLKVHREQVHLLTNLCQCSLCGKLVHLSKKQKHVHQHSKHGEEITMLTIHDRRSHSPVDIEM